MTRLFRITDAKLDEVTPAKLPQEQLIEEWIARDPSILGLDLLIIGRQVVTDHGGKIDLLAIDRDGIVWVIECKRDRTPRDVISQLLDYGSWVGGLPERRLHEVAEKYLRKPLSLAFSEWAEEPLDELIDGEHRLLVVASSFDEPSRRIVAYLTTRFGVPINAAFFRVFRDGDQMFLASTWLLDPEDAEARTQGKKGQPWTGYWFVNVASGPGRDWEDCRRFGFISAGGGRKWSRQLERLRPGAPIYAYVKGKGYVGFGVVSTAPVMAAEFRLDDGRGLADLELRNRSVLNDATDPELAEYIVQVDWKKTVSTADAVTFPGVFANQAVACRLSQPETLKQLAAKLGSVSDLPPQA